MGGMIALKLAETWPREFAGVFPACAVAGGLTNEYDYALHVRALFDVFYPGVLPGSAVEVPADIDVLLQIVTPAVAAMTLDPSGAFLIAQMAQTPVPFANGPELVESIARALGIAASYPEVLELTRGQPYFDNTATVYSGPLPAATLTAINASVQRFSGTVGARQLLEQNYTPTGDLRIPALTLSIFRDPVVPGLHDIFYAEQVAAQGNDGWLVQRSVPGYAGGYGHCTFTAEEVAQAFTDLVTWGEFGVKPSP